MTKKWKQSELNRIYRDNPELKKAPLVGIDVEARPPKDTSRRDGAIAGAQLVPPLGRCQALQASQILPLMPLGIDACKQFFM